MVFHFKEKKVWWSVVIHLFTFVYHHASSYLSGLSATSEHSQLFPPQWCCPTCPFYFHTGRIYRVAPPATQEIKIHCHVRAWHAHSVGWSRLSVRDKGNSARGTMLTQLPPDLGTEIGGPATTSMIKMHRELTLVSEQRNKCGTLIKLNHLILKITRFT